MGKNQSASNLPNIIQSSNGSINFVSGSTLLMQISSSGAITTTGVISGSNALSSSYALNSERLDNLDSTSFVFTSSYNSDSSSFSTRVTNNESTGSTLTTASASFAVVSSSYSTASGSLSTRVSKIEGNYATTGSNVFLGAQTVCANITSTGTIIAQTLNVQQVTSSIVYSSGSNIFGCQLTDVQQMTGSLRVTGSFNVAGPSCISGCVNIATGNQIRLTNCARNNWVQIESPLVGGDAAIDFKLTTQSGVVYMNNTGVTCFNNAICAPRGEFTSDASCVPLRLINGVITGGSTTGVTALYLGDVGSGVSMLQREKYAANQANLVLYSEYGYNTQSINACMGYNGVALYTAGTKRLNIDGTGITCFSGLVCIGSSSTVTGGGLLKLGVANGNAGAALQFLGWAPASGFKSWQIDTAYIGGDVLSFTPSTTAGGTTFTTPVLSIGSSGISCFSSTVCAKQYSATFAADGDNIATFINSASSYLYGPGGVFIGSSTAHNCANLAGGNGALIIRNGASTYTAAIAYNGTAYFCGNVGIGISPSYRLDVCSADLEAARFSRYCAGTGISNGQIAQFVNLAASAVSSYIYIGSAPGLDWKIGKNVTNVAGNYDFTITDSNNNIRLKIDCSGITNLANTVCATTFRASSRIISNYTQIYDGDFSLNIGNTRSVVICGAIYTLGDFHLMAYGNAGTGMSSIRLSTYGYFANSNLLGFCEQLRYTFGSLTISSVSNNGTSLSFNIGNCSGSHNATGFYRMISLTGDSANSCVQVFIL